jgi:hypothetical protein
MNVDLEDVMIRFRRQGKSELRGRLELCDLSCRAEAALERLRDRQASDAARLR